MTNNQVMEQYLAEYKKAIEDFKNEQKRIAKEVMDDQTLYFTNQFGAAYSLKIDQLQMAATKIKIMQDMICRLLQTFEDADKAKYNEAIRNL